MKLKKVQEDLNPNEQLNLFSSFSFKFLRKSRKIIRIILKKIEQYRFQNLEKSGKIPIFNYSISIISVLIAFLFKLVLDSYIGVHEGPLFLLFFAAIIVSAWYGGIKTGLMSTILSSLFINYFFSSSGYNFLFNESEKNLLLVMFVLEGVLISWLSGELLSTMRKAKNLTKNLKREKDILQIIMENTDTHLAYLDTKFNFIKVNSSYAKSSGYTKSQLIGHNHFKLFPNSENQKIFEKVKKTRESIEFTAKPFIFKYQPERGITYWDWSLIPVKDFTGKVKGFVFSLNDVTEQKRKEEIIHKREQEFEALVENAPDIISRYNKKMHLIYINKAIKEVSGVFPEDFIERTTEELGIPKKISSHFENAIKKVLKTGREETIESYLPSVSGELRYYQSRLVPELSKNSEVESVLAISRDITNRKRTEEALKESEMKLRSIVQSTSDAIISTNSKGQIVSWNKGADESFGYKENEILGKSLTVLMPVTYRKNHEIILNNADKNESLQVTGRTLEMIGLRKNGEEFPIELSLSTWKINNNKFYTSIIRDTTERKLSNEVLRELNKRITNILESITDAFFTLNKDWQFTYINRQAEYFFQKRREEVLGKNLWEEFPNLIGTIFHEKYIEAMMNKIPIHFEGYLKRQKKWLEVRSYPSIDGLSIYLHDITDRKEVEERKDEFISVASHELRTPLTSVRAYTQILQKNLKHLKDNETDYYFGRVNDQLNNLTKLIRDLLDVSKVQAARLELSEDKFDIDELINEIVDDLKHIKLKHSIIIKGKVKENIIADKYRISQVINNLISNAIKYSPNADKIIISINKDESNIIIAVQDFGIGISSENREKIFDRFFRISNTKGEKVSGLGIGLYIAAEIIKRHGGKIWLESAEGKGSTFYFTLPLKRQLSAMSTL